MRKSAQQFIYTAITMLPLISAEAHEISENLSLDGVLSGSLHCQQLTDSTDGVDVCKGAIPLQPELTYSPTSNHRLFLKLGFAAGNGLNEVSPFNIPPWGADLEDDVKNINGSGRNHVLEAWFQHVVELDRRNRIGLTLGIIDASNYLDQNAFANDEYMQFMNPALSNAPNTFFPAYDLGIAAEWYIGDWAFSGVIMDVHQFNGPDKYTFYGLQAGYRLETGLGTGNYRISLNGDRDFIDEVGQSKQKNDILIVSADQKLGDSIGVFTRVGWRLDDEPINYRAIYSGGIDIRGATWGRVLDNIGIGLVYLDGGNRRIIRTRIAEAYYRMVINPYLAFSGDIQYMRDQYFQRAGAEGFIYSLRATVNF
jgi:porin